MTLKKKKNNFRPVYKQLIILKENIQNRDKLLRFKKEKWKKTIEIYKRKLNLYKKVKSRDQMQYIVSRHAGMAFSYKKKYKNILHETKKFKLFYGYLPDKTINVFLNKKCRKVNFINFLKLFESRLDVTLYRAKFSLNTRDIAQLIYHGKVFVNEKPIKIKSYLLKPGDIITIKPKYYKLIKFNVLKSVWPFFPKHLIVNYKTMQVVFSSLKNVNISLDFFCRLNLEKVLEKYYQS